nr:serine-rich adhesin for platelets-like isoform X2 [Lepeophtheirus salmonis]
MSSTTDASTTMSSTTDASTTMSSTTDASTTILRTSTTDASTTMSSTTDASTTMSSTTDASTTMSSTTDASTTMSSTTNAQTTMSSTTDASTTISSTTDASTTMSSTTDASTTMSSTTNAQTPMSSTTDASTILSSTTDASTTMSSTTDASTKISSTTNAPTTISSTTDAPTTMPSTTMGQTTMLPTTDAPTTLPPTTNVPTTMVSTTTMSATSRASTTMTPTTGASTTTTPDKCQTSEQIDCIFPFIYSGVSYNECTDVENNGVEWCATSLYANSEAQNYGNCNSNCKGQCKTIEDLKCIFPFIYSGVSYNGCTDVENNGVEWCATSLYANSEAQNYGNCNSDCKGQCKTIEDVKCTFPFIYSGVSYNGCTDVENNGVEWCATSLYANSEAQNYGNCNSDCKGQCTTTEDVKCTFPFIYSGVFYNGCTDVDNNGVKWCATSLFANSEAQNYGNCNSDCNDNCKTTQDVVCIFPFIYSGITYNECTDVDNNGVKWCATALHETKEAFQFGNCNANC